MEKYGPVFPHYVKTMGENYVERKNFESPLRQGFGGQAATGGARPLGAVFRSRYSGFRIGARGAEQPRPQRGRLHYSDY